MPMNGLYESTTSNFICKSLLMTDIKAIIEAISQNGDKIDDVNFFLNKIQNQNQDRLKNFL